MDTTAGATRPSFFFTPAVNPAGAVPSKRANGLTEGPDAPEEDTPMTRTLILFACLATAALTATPAGAERLPPFPPPPVGLLLPLPPLPPPFPIIIHDRHDDRDDDRYDRRRDRRDERRGWRSERRHDHRHEQRCEVCRHWPPAERHWRQHRHDRHNDWCDEPDERRHDRRAWRDRYDRR